MNSTKISKDQQLYKDEGDVIVGPYELMNPKGKKFDRVTLTIMTNFTIQQRRYLKNALLQVER